MAAERWLDAHDVVTGELMGEDAAQHDHAAMLAARLLQGICEQELAGTAGLEAALTAHEALLSAPLPCGCLLPVETLHPFVDLAKAFAALDVDEANEALGFALAAGLARPGLSSAAAVIAARAEAALELLPAGDALSDGSDDGDGLRVAIPRADELGELEERTLAEAPPAAEDEDELPALSALHALVGLGAVKECCQNLKDAASLERERGDDPKQKSHALVLTGNPGTGKSEAAALYAQLLCELKIVPAGRVVRVTGAQLQDEGLKGLEEILKAFDEPGDSVLGVGDTVEVRREGSWGHFGRIVHHDTSRDARPQFRGTYDVHFGKMRKFEMSNGTTATWRDHDFDIGVRRKDIRARDETGGVLIIDDAHQLEPASDKGARQVLYKLSEEMDRRGGKFALVMAGYEKATYEQVLGFNNGALASRMRRRFALADFDDEELIALLERLLATAKPSYHVQDAKYVRLAARRVGKGRGSLGFGNARAVQALLDAAAERQTARIVAERRRGLSADIFEFERADLLGEERKALSTENCESLRKLHEMEGLVQVKASVASLLKLAESNAQREELELPLAEVSLNRIFLGNPGTGKTTVARRYGQILRELGLLSRGDVVLATPSDLIGSALGQSEEKTNAMLDKSEGCVLVIDEAYGLDPAGGGSFGGAGGGGSGGGGDPYKTAVVDTIVSRVQGDAGADRCVLLLGYRKEMERFIRRGNPGLARRFQLEKAFEFEDYDDQALLRILLRNVAGRGRAVGFDAAKQVVRRDLAKARMRPNFGNAGAVDNAVSAAVLRAEARLEALPAAERALQNELLLEDFIVEKPHVADPSLVFEGLIGCEQIKTRLAEYQAVIAAASQAGRDPLDDLALTFCFQGAPGTGKTTIARRMGMLFESLGVLPSEDVIQVSASQFSTGFVGQTAANTRDIFDSARGAVLFIDEAYRLYDPLGRSYMQEAVDEIVNLLTEEQYRGKMVVIFAGYAGEMSDLLEKVNPGLKSRVSDVIDFADFTVDAAAELAAMQLAGKRLDLPGEAGPRSLEPWLRQLVAAPRWANGRDVETFTRRVAVECATRQSTVATDEALDAALRTVLQAKGLPSAVGSEAASVRAPAAESPFLAANPASLAAPTFDLQKALRTAKMEGDGEDGEDGEDGPPSEEDFANAIEEAMVALGYDNDGGSRAELARKLAMAAEGLAPFPEDIRSRVARKTGASEDAVDAACQRNAKPMMVAVTAAIAYRAERQEELEELEDGDKEKEQDRDAQIMERLRTMGPCPAGYSWFRQGNGWRCGGGSHFVYDDDPILNFDD